MCLIQCSSKIKLKKVYFSLSNALLMMELCVYVFFELHAYQCSGISFFLYSFTDKVLCSELLVFFPLDGYIYSLYNFSCSFSFSSNIVFPLFWYALLPAVSASFSNFAFFVGQHLFLFLMLISPCRVYILYFVLFVYDANSAQSPVPGIINIENKYITKSNHQLLWCRVGVGQIKHNLWLAA